MRGTSTRRTPTWMPWTWRIGGPLAAVVWIEVGAPTVGLIILGYAIVLDIRWWRQNRRRA